MCEAMGSTPAAFGLLMSAAGCYTAAPFFLRI